MEDLSDDDIVISGISGRFPSSNNLNEFAYNLYNKIDMTDEDESRWKHFHADVPKRFGKIRNLEKFDASFFSTLNKHANWTDPQMRILLEHSYEAILDAGISPQSLIGSKTGVFIGCSISDSKDAFVHRYPPKDGYVVLGNAQFYLSNRISYALGLCGPSFTVDTACSSSAYALDCAFRYLQSGMCDAALVGGSQLILNCGLAAEYTKLGILASDGVCRPFDEDATGFVRADTICVIFLQKLKDSKRIYANIVYSSSNNDGFKKEGASFPSKIMQQKLIEDFYKTLKLDPEMINFVETHTTGTKLGDPEEVSAIDEAFCKNNNRNGELIIGSVKSNMGHAEAASGMASIAKILVAFENQKFPPNINLKTLRSDVPAFAEKRIKVATEAIDLTGNYIAMNSFGLGGANAHALFRGNTKQKINFGIPNDDMHRLVLWSGRTEEAVNVIFDDIIKRPLDAEHIALLQNSQVVTTTANTYRGFGIFKHDYESEKAKCLTRDIQYFNGTHRPIVFVFSGIGSQWSQMGKDLMEIPLFAKSIEKSHQVLTRFNLNLKEILTQENNFENVLNSYVGIVSIEIALVDILKALGIEPDFMIGHSVGELCCAYADGCFTAEETILAAYARGSSSNEAKTIEGAMAAIGINHVELENILPQDIDVACHNAIDSTTISGPIESVRAFVEEMKKKKVFAREVACSGIPLHSRYITEFGENLYKKLKEIIKTPRARSKKWLSSTYPEDMWIEEEAFYSSAEYHTRNLLNPVFFQEVTELLPQNAITIEVAPHGLLKSILKRSMKDGIQINLTQKDCKDGVSFFTETLGRLFENGVDMDVSNLYPSVQFPVSRGTPMISPNIKWNHEDNHFVPHFDSYNTFERRNIIINISDKKFEFIQGHLIDGRFLFPATGWIFLVWETFAMMCGVHYEKMKVILEDIHFLRATSLNKHQDVLITVSIHRGTGRFEVIEGSAAVVHGYIKQVDEIEMSEIPELSDENTLTLNSDDFYKEFRMHGFSHLGAFKGVHEIRHDGLKGKIKWVNNWITFLDSMTHFEELQTNAKQLALPTNIRKIVIDPFLHFKIRDEAIKAIKVEENKIQEGVEGEESNAEILYNVEICPYQRIIKAGGVELHDKRNRVVNRRRQKEPNLEVYKFIPFFSDEKFQLEDATRILVQTVLEDIFQPKFASIEIDDDDSFYLSENIAKALRKIPLIASNVTFLSKRENLQLEGVEVSSEEINSFSGLDMIIKPNCLNDSEFLESTKSLIKERGFVVSIDSKKIEVVHNDFKIVSQIQAKFEESTKIISIMRSQFESFESHKTIEISSKVEDWLEPLQNAIKESPVILYSSNYEPSGILGFVNCVRREFVNDKIKCVLINDSNTPKFEINNNFYKSQLDQGHAINIFKNGEWGSYRHIGLPKDNKLNCQKDHCYANCLIKGDLSTLAWLRGQLKIDDNEIIKLKYASLNFKDVMIALGRIPDNIFDRIGQNCALGLEVSGVKKDGTRVMGLALNTSGISTHYDAKKSLLWDVPNEWTLEEAATVPLVYTTVYFAYFVTTQIKAGKTILIHSGSGGVGQAAIEIAFAYGLDVFTTVSSEEKKNFLLKKFPKLKPSNIGNSRNISFEKLILTNTKGKGVDYVLNSLSDEKLHASIRCLGKGGTLLEIGKYDIVRGTQLDMRYLEKRITFKAVIFDDLPADSEEMEIVYNLIKDDLKHGIIKPLNSTVFDACEIEEAFRFMAAGKHIGKVLLKIREDENDDKSLPLSVLSRVYCDPNESYLIIGGLGGFGLELADWLVVRGCRKLVLSSSRGFKNEYQVLKVELWKTYGTKVIISTSDVTTEDGCKNLLHETLSLGPVGGIFNLAVVLRDGIFENLDTKMFYESTAPKALATINLDKLSREMCPSLKHFVVFSSVSCGMGNAGQSNYGFANSVMERIVEKRCEAGLPGKAIQWGAIGDVGLLADFQLANANKDIGGTLPQSIASCIEVLDELLTSEDPIVSSMIVADKQASNIRKGNIIDMILKIMGVRDRKSISMDSTLTQLGIDSLMGVEIAQLLERDFDIVLTSQELRSLTLAQLEKRAMSKTSGKDNSNDNNSEEFTWMKLLLSGVIDEETLEIFSIEQIYKANDIESNDRKVLILPGFYGVAADLYKNLAKKLKYSTYILQLYETSECIQLDEIIKIIGPEILKLFSNNESFILIGHSFGAVIALKIAKLLEKNGKKNGQIFELDGSPQYIHRLSHKFSLEGNEEQFKSGVAMITFDILRVHLDEAVVKNAYEAHEGWEEKLKVLMENSKGKFSFDADFIQTNIMHAVANRLKICQNTKDDSFSPLESTNIFLTRASKPAITGIHKDYGLARLCSSPIKINVLEGDHVTLVNNQELIKFINENI